jgi:glycosyltransferase involved in cell wall biosynthesis
VTRRLISVIAPAYNEEDCVEELVRRLAAVFDSNYNYDFEAVIVENGSTDSTFELLKRASKVDGRFKVLRLSRNFGMDGGITAGLEHISGTPPSS